MTTTNPRRTYVAAIAIALIGTAAVVSSLPALQDVTPGVRRASGPGSTSSYALHAPCDARTPISSLPFTITTCGSYVLTNCLTGSAARNGITIDADDVTIDLAGFSLLGVPGSGDAIHAIPGRRNVTVHGGNVRGWGGGGVNLGGESSVIHDLRSSNNLGAGIATGIGGNVRDCTAQGNQGDGFLIGFGSTIVNSVAVDNQGNGIHLAVAATVTGCTAIACTVRSNAQAGILGGDGCVVRDCSTNFNGVGIAVGVGSTIQGCSAVLNAGDGIATFGSLVRGNSSQNNGGAQINAPTSTVIENH